MRSDPSVSPKSPSQLLSDEEHYKRSKERRIDFVIDKVKTWRRLFNGVPDDLTGNLIRYSLEDAAQ